MNDDIKKVIDDYLGYLKVNFIKSNVKRKKIGLNKFLMYLKSNNINCFKKIPKTWYLDLEKEFHAKKFTISTIKAYLDRIKYFIKYLIDKKMVSKKILDSDLIYHSDFKKYFYYLKKEKGITGTSLKQIKSGLKRFMIYVKEKKITDFKDFTIVSIENLLCYFKKYKSNDKTITNRLYRLRIFFDYLFEVKKISSNPFVLYMKKEKKKYADEITNVLCDYTKYLKVKNDKNIQHRDFAIKSFINFIGKNDISGFVADYGIAEDYKVYLSKCKSFDDGYYHRRTINNKLIYLKQFYQYLQKKGLSYTNPFEEVKHLKVNHCIPKNILKEEEIEILFSGITIKDKKDMIFYLACEIMYSCGLRVSEVEKLKIDNILFEKGILIARDIKTKKEKYVPINDYCLNLIKLYVECMNIEDNKYLFPQKSKYGTLIGYMNRRLKKICKKSGLKMITTHCFRHSMATHMLKNGAKLREIQAILGHKKLSTTEIYTRVAKEDLKKILKEKHPRENIFYQKESVKNEVITCKTSLQTKPSRQQITRKYYKTKLIRIK